MVMQEYGLQTLDFAPLPRFAWVTKLKPFQVEGGLFPVVSSHDVRSRCSRATSLYPVWNLVTQCRSHASQELPPVGTQSSVDLNLCALGKSEACWT